MRIQKIKLLKIKQWTYINLDKGEILTYMYSHTNVCFDFTVTIDR